MALPWGSRTPFFRVTWTRAFIGRIAPTRGLKSWPDLSRERPARQAVEELERVGARSEEHTSELQSLMRISYAVFCLNKKKNQDTAVDSRHRIRHAPK